MPSLTGPECSLPRRLKLVLVADLVESVSLMQADELGVIVRWQSFLAHVSEFILPTNDGRLVKSLGDGLMVEFDVARKAARAAAAMHAWMANCCEPLADGKPLALRVGLHAAHVFLGNDDVYGAGVNLAARVATLAEAGETVATAQVRDLLDDVLDADIQDLGECHLKHIDKPVRAFRIGPAREFGRMPSRAMPAQLWASVAVVPFACLFSTQEFAAIGDLLADGIIEQLSLSPDLHVVSRLSSGTFKGRPSSLIEIATHLDVRYVVSGSYVVTASSLAVTAELADASNDRVLWATRLRGDWRDLLVPESELIQQLAGDIHGRLLESTAAKASTCPLPTLQSYELFLGGIALMHRASSDDFDISRSLLESITERHRSAAAAHAWLAKWYVLRAIQGAIDDVPRAASIALEHTRRALASEPTSALALAMEGFVYAHLKQDIDSALPRLARAREMNPSEGLAWLFSGVIHAFLGDSEMALASGHRALALSPLDPLRYYYESLMGSCEFSAGHYAEAIRWCESSRKRNRQHLSTLRVLIAAYTAADQGAQALLVANDLRRLRPGYTVAAYEAQSVAARYPFGQQIARALRSAGIPG
ncbi:adenylate/guanylate cyclase domain-containing protein [Variovorax ginsengisoli]|uniref:Adenylate/guanylate cyclase domain-containing protein n=1 Tax=Variovorax ginsengisoli TaxID=363844 RepID=A0ABT8S8M7_9BURK|nr:adenylate/guanylate cyclase domain-containing protein [Variovorax ginsengisoli]MDN8616076.1 adenylate/guanylate cyclase domain-containing protein [Variovorax ginsengisoli]MDO1535246.1 adenylate/guanylate cyclase domain-containing protein [Variovorax ginsengisoli]